MHQHEPDRLGLQDFSVLKMHLKRYRIDQKMNRKNPLREAARQVHEIHKDHDYRCLFVVIPDADFQVSLASVFDALSKVPRSRDHLG